MCRIKIKAKIQNFVSNPHFFATGFYPVSDLNNRDKPSVEKEPPYSIYQAYALVTVNRFMKKIILLHYVSSSAKRRRLSPPFMNKINHFALN